MKKTNFALIRRLMVMIIMFIRKKHFVAALRCIVLMFMFLWIPLATAAGHAGSNLNDQTEGPAVDGIQAAGGRGVNVMPAENNTFVMEFPAGTGRPAALFSFKKTDIEDRLGLALDVKNTGLQPVRVYADLNEDTMNRGCVTVAPGMTETLYVLARRAKFAAGDAEKFSGMHGIPGGKMSACSGLSAPIRANKLKVFVVAGAQPASIQTGNIRPFGSSKIPDLSGFYPFIDKYGQYKHKTWPGKILSDTDFKTSMECEDADMAKHPGPEGLNQYGGWAAGPKLKSTGHFRTEKYNGKWWLVDPAGNLFWSNGVDCVTYPGRKNIQGRESYFEDPLPDGNFLLRNLQTKYGSDWFLISMKRNLRRFKSWGLNTAGAWSAAEFTGRQWFPYTVCLSSGLSPQNGPGAQKWEDNLRNVMKKAGQSLNNDPWCIGFFVDNEINTSKDPEWFELYYRKVNALAREFLPDKLYLGSRLDYHNWPDETPARHEIVRRAAKYCDIISFNFYKLTVEDVVLPEGIDKPVIVGEFHMGALDRGLFHTGLRGVIDQNHRAEAYRYYVTTALKNPAIIGAHWFQLYDQPATGRPDGENYQIGFLDGCDTPYPETISAVREIGYKLYSIRMDGANACPGR